MELGGGGNELELQSRLYSGISTTDLHIVHPRRACPFRVAFRPILTITYQYYRRVASYCRR